MPRGGEGLFLLHWLSYEKLNHCMLCARHSKNHYCTEITLLSKELEGTSFDISYIRTGLPRSLVLGRALSQHWAGERVRLQDFAVENQLLQTSYGINGMSDVWKFCHKPLGRISASYFLFKPKFWSFFSYFVQYHSAILFVLKSLIVLASVVRKVNSAINRIVIFSNVINMSSNWWNPF